VKRWDGERAAKYAILNSNEARLSLRFEITESIVGWNRMKRAFFASVAISLIGGVTIQIAIHSGSGDITTLLNLGTVFALVGGLGMALGIILLGRWISMKINQLSANRKERFFAQSEKYQKPQNNEGQKTNVTDRWNALVKYDEEIRAAAEKLRPFGDFWVTELGKAYLALSEDRKYLPNIVSRLVEEAERDKAQNWMKPFRQTADGTLCTEKSLNILREAMAQGYVFGVDQNKAFTVTKDGSKSFLYSNSDIEGFGRTSKILPRSTKGGASD
jgi:hypothetical protein